MHACQRREETSANFNPLIYDQQRNSVATIGGNEDEDENLIAAERIPFLSHLSGKHLNSSFVTMRRLRHGSLLNHNHNNQELLNNNHCLLDQNNPNVQINQKVQNFDQLVNHQQK